MRLKEFSDPNMAYDPAQDVNNKRTLSDTRKPRLTLRHINKLRKMREAKKLEMADGESNYASMYGMPEEDTSQSPF
jgi:hypothetical protein